MAENKNLPKDIQVPLILKGQEYDTDVKKVITTKRNYYGIDIFFIFTDPLTTSLKKWI